jgi:hypothetical protein
MRSIMHRPHVITLISFVCLQALVGRAIAEDSASEAPSAAIVRNAPSAESGAKEVTLPTDSDESEKREAILQAIDEAIAVSRNYGDADEVAKWQGLRAEYAATESDECATKAITDFISIVCGLRDHNELREAERLVPFMIRSAKSVRKGEPRLFFAAEREASAIEVDFERYESALKHMMIAMRFSAQECPTRSCLSSSLANYAYVLRKLNRLNEAEGIYLSVQEDIKQNPEGVTKDAILDLRFAIATLYAEKGEFEKYRKTVPDQPEDLYNEDGEFVPRRAVVMARAYINFNLPPNGDLTRAADKGQRHSDWTREYFGVSSRQHVEALELLSKVRIAQKDYDEAEKLLKKSADLRSTLLGNEHSSITRTYKEIDAIRKQMLDDAHQLIWPKSTEREVADRYAPKVE